MLITMELLKKWGACNLKDCRPFIGDGVELTGAVVIAAHEAGILDADWLAEKVLSAEMLAKYKRVRAQAWAEYERVEGQVWAECERVMAPALAKYKRVEAQAWAKYERVTAQTLASLIDEHGK